MSIRDELLALRDDERLIHVDTVIIWASEHRNSDVAQAIEWDDLRAAASWRRDQVRQLIQIHIVDVDHKRLTISLVRDRGQGGGYRNIDDVLSNMEMRRAALLDAVSEFERLSARHDHFSELEPIFATIQEVAGRLRRPVARPRRQLIADEAIRPTA